MTGRGCARRPKHAGESQQHPKHPNCGAMGWWAEGASLLHGLLQAGASWGHLEHFGAHLGQSRPQLQWASAGFSTFTKPTSFCCCSGPEGALPRAYAVQPIDSRCRSGLDMSTYIRDAADSIPANARRPLLVYMRGLDGAPSGSASSISIVPRSMFSIISTTLTAE